MMDIASTSSDLVENVKQANRKSARKPSAGLGANWVLPRGEALISAAFIVDISSSNHDLPCTCVSGRVLADHPLYSMHGSSAEM